jgi:voltage-gated potassium channel
VESHDRPSADVVHIALVRLAGRTTCMIALLTVAYYALPIESPAFDGPTGARLLAAAVSVSLAAVVVRAQLRALRGGPRIASVVEALLTTLYLLIVLFATVYYGLGVNTEQFAGLETKTDGLYFTTTVVATVGFGDIHAQGAGARALVTAQMLFSLLYIGTAFRLLSARGMREPADRPH